MDRKGREKNPKVMSVIIIIVNIISGYVAQTNIYTFNRVNDTNVSICNTVLYVRGPVCQAQLDGPSEVAEEPTEERSVSHRLTMSYCPASSLMTETASRNYAAIFA